MIRNLPGFVASSAGCQPVSRRKKTAIFEVAARLTLIAEKSRLGGPEVLRNSALLERRKQLKLGLDLCARGMRHESIDAAFRKPAFARSEDPGERLETLVIRAGIHALSEGDHPFLIFRKMTAFLGLEFYAKSNDWLAARITRRRKSRTEELIVPGDLPDVIRELAKDRILFERVIRTTGRDIMSASLAGCPRESLQLIKPVFGKVGGTILEDNMLFLKSRLSTEEIAAAQSTFLEIERTIHNQKQIQDASGPETSQAQTDSANIHYIRELTRIILDIEDRPLKIALSGTEARTLAAAMQGMEPAGHERILSSLGKRDEKRLLDALDNLDLLETPEIQRAATQVLARLSEASIKSGKQSSEIINRINSFAESVISKLT